MSFEFKGDERPRPVLISLWTQPQSDLTNLMGCLTPIILSCIHIFFSIHFVIIFLTCNENFQLYVFQIVFPSLS